MEIFFKKEIDFYLVTFPDYITLKCLKKWGGEIKAELETSGSFGMLIDTNMHNFESIECLKWLRQFLSDLVSIKCITIIAFIQPDTYRAPEVVSDKEAYFSDTDSAKKWLELKRKKWLLTKQSTGLR